MTDREKLVERLKTNACPSPFMCDPACRYYYDCLPDRFADYILAHSVTVREPGEWLFTEYAYTLECSVCKGHMSGGKTKYCPYCGSPMKGESNV